MDDLKGKKILIFQQRMWGINIGHFLAKRIQAEGCSLAAFTLKKTTHDFIMSQKEVKYENITSMDEIMEDPKKYLQDNSYSLKEICEDLGVDSVWPLVYSLRNHIKSYKDKYYYGFKQNVSDEEIVNYVKAIYKYIKFIFHNFGPNIIIAPNFVSLPHIMINLYGLKRGIKMITVTDCKVRGYRIFSEDYQDSIGSFFARIKELNEFKTETSSRENAKKYIKEFRENFKSPDYAFKEQKKLNLLHRIKREIYPYKQILRWYIKGPSENYLKSIGPSIDYKPPRIILRDFYCERKYRKFMDNFNYYPLEKIDKLIYFPLQYQPEASIDVMAPYFSNQIEIARQVAMSMPDDYVLVVKEHPGMVGLRPPSYIEKVARTPNVKLVDYRISGERILKKADLVISPNSTTIAEAAFLRKPAIQLGDLGTTLLLPNAFKHSDMTSLSSKIKEILSIDLNTDEFERKLENFIAAAFDTGFDINYNALWEKGRGDSMENLWILFRNEIIKALAIK